MAKFKALARGYLSMEHRLIEKGETFEWDGPVSPWMEPVKNHEESQPVVKKDDPNQHGSAPRNAKAFKG